MVFAHSLSDPFALAAASSYRPMCCPYFIFWICVESHSRSCFTADVQKCLPCCHFNWWIHIGFSHWPISQFLEPLSQSPSRLHLHVPALWREEGCKVPKGCRNAQLTYGTKSVSGLQSTMPQESSSPQLAWTGQQQSRHGRARTRDPKSTVASVALPHAAAQAALNLQTTKRTGLLPKVNKPWFSHPTRIDEYEIHPREKNARLELKSQWGLLMYLFI